MAEKPKADKGKAEEGAPAKAGMSKKMLIIIVVGALVLVGGSMGGLYFVLKAKGMLGAPTSAAGGKEGAKEGGAHGAADKEAEKHDTGEPPAPAHYVPMEQPFVVNFNDNGKSRFLQVQLELMTREPKAVKHLKEHAPLIRNNVLMLLSQQPAEMLHSTLGKEQIRLAVLAEIKKVLKQETGEEIVEAVYFTSFVTQ